MGQKPRYTERISCWFLFVVYFWLIFWLGYVRYSRPILDARQFVAHVILYRSFITFEFRYRKMNMNFALHYFAFCGQSTSGVGM